MTYTRPLLILTLALLAAGCATTSRQADLTVPLTYRPTSRVTTSYPGDLGITAGKVYLPAATDDRADKTKIGENIEDEGRAPKPIYAGGPDAATFVHDAVARELSNAGIQVVDSAPGADRTLAIKLNRFSCTESNTYKTDIRCTFDLMDATGRSLFNSSFAGENSRFGRSLSPANYQETYSDAVVDMISALLSNPAFQKALTK